MSIYFTILLSGFYVHVVQIMHSAVKQISWSSMLNHIPTHWPSIILDTMLKAKRFPRYPLPYSLLISRIFEYKGVNVSDKQSHKTTKANKIAENSLK